jgi:hypothetical protein
VGATINLVLNANKFLIKTHTSQPTAPMLRVGMHATFADFHHGASAATPSHKNKILKCVSRELNHPSA